MTTTFTSEHRAKLTEYLSTHDLARGLGDEHSACSIAAINLAINGKLTDNVPDCMSRVIGKWIITAQDRMPSEIRNSDRWKSLLPFAAGTGRDKETERLAIVMDWMWSALERLQPVADAGGYGDKWREMLKYKTQNAAAATAARAAYAGARYANVYAARAAADAARAAADAAWAAADAAWAAADAAADADAAAWSDVDPCGLLEKLINA